MGLPFKKLVIAAVAGASLLGAALASADPAEARWRGHHRGGWGWGGPALVGGLALGTAIGAGSYAYAGGCPLVRQVVGYRPSGRPIVRWVRSCY
jgi:hypothetical protein